MGPLEGIRIIEIAGIGPGPFCAMMLSDMGADVLRIDRAERVRAGRGTNADPLGRGRKSVAVDLKNPEGIELILKLVERSDALFEGFRPGVMERLGIGPEPCLARNPRLIYGRMTGWGQEGPMAHASGHDINYIALAGALEAIGRRGEKPVPPLNLVGDFGGGGMLLAYGMVCALVERQRSGKGQVVDAAMVDGASVLMTMFHGMRKIGMWKDERGVNLIDSGAHFYDTYECKDGKYVALGSIEPQFYAELMRLLELPADELGPQMDPSRWEANREKLAAIFRRRTRDEWCAILEGSDACFAPVLSMTEAPEHPHNKQRNAFVEIDGLVQPAPAPRFSRTPPAVQGPGASAGQHTKEALRDWGFDATEIDRLSEAKAIAQG